jgi:hypothetical protein
MNRQRHDLNQIRIQRGCIRVGNWQRLPFLQQDLGKILHRAGNHQPGVGQIEALTNRAGKIENLRDHHFARRVRKIKRHMISKHNQAA